MATTEELIKTIEGNVPKVYEAGQKSVMSEVNEKLDKKSNALIGEKVGASITFDDIAPDTNAVTVSVESKNLVPLVYKTANRGTSVTISGVTFTVNSDGSITLNGKNNGNDNSSFFLVSSTAQPLVLKKGTYIGRTWVDGHGLSGLVHETGKYMSFTSPYTIEEDTAFRFLYFGVGKGSTREFNGETVYPMLMRGTVCEDYVEPVANGTSVTLSRDGQEISTAVGETVEFVEGADCGVIEQGSSIISDNEGVALHAEYNRDINIAFAELRQAIISLGGNV